MQAFLLATAALLFSSFHRAPSDELKRERLPADVDFVVHLDLEGFKQTELWKQVNAMKASLDIDLGELDEFKTHYGIDPLTDVRAVTLYKVASEEDPTVVLFSTTDKVDVALRAFQLEPGYALVTESGIPLHTWKTTDDGKEETVCAYVHALAGSERVVVLANNKASAVRAARVLRGELPNHAQSGSLLTIAPAPGSFLYVAAKGLPELADTPASPVFGLAQGIQVDLGEAGGLLRAHMGVTTESPEKAGDLSRFIDGMLALGSLARDQIGAAVDVLRALRLNTRGSEVTVDFEFGVRRLMDILASLDDDDDADADAPAGK